MDADPFPILAYPSESESSINVVARSLPFPLLLDEPKVSRSVFHRNSETLGFVARLDFPVLSGPGTYIISYK